MWSWLRKPRTQEEIAAPLRGTPARPRTKTYSADTGFVYQYAYRGYRQIEAPDGAREQIFAISRDRANSLDLRILIRTDAIHACEEQIGRSLLDAELYAIAKLTLFSTFDTVPELTALAEPIVPSAADMEMHLRRLGRV